MKVNTVKIKDPDCCIPDPLRRKKKSSLVPLPRKNSMMYG